MRYFVGLALVLSCSGCAGDRAVLFKYYPNTKKTEVFPRIAERECAKYGRVAVYSGTGSAEYGSVTQAWRCEAN